MATSTLETRFRSLDGTQLAGTIETPDDLRFGIVMVHGGGVTREEGGFYTRMTQGLANRGIGSLRFDLRAHGASEGRMNELTLAGILNDIRAALVHLRSTWAIEGLGFGLMGASFGGGISALYAARRPDDLQRLVLINPLLNYKRRFVDDKPYWSDEQIDEPAGRELARVGSLAHSPTFRLGVPLLNEVFFLQPHAELGNVRVPTLVVHGTGDTFVPVQSSRDAVAKFGGSVELHEIEGAQHGIAVPDDPRYEHAQTQQWQASTIDHVGSWLEGDRGGQFTDR